MKLSKNQLDVLLTSLKFYEETIYELMRDMNPIWYEKNKFKVGKLLNTIESIEVKLKNCYGTSERNNRI